MSILWGLLFSGFLYAKTCTDVFFNKLEINLKPNNRVQTLYLVNKETGRQWGSLTFEQEGYIWKIKKIEVDELLRRHGMGSVLLQTFYKEAAKQALKQRYTKIYIQLFDITPELNKKEFFDFLAANQLKYVEEKQKLPQWFRIMNGDLLVEYLHKTIPVEPKAFNQNYGLDYSLVKKVPLTQKQILQKLHKIEYYRSENIDWDEKDFQELLKDTEIKTLYAISGQDLIGFALYSNLGNEIDILNFGVDLSYTRDDLRATYIPMIEKFKSLLIEENKYRIKILLPADHVKTIELLLSQDFKIKRKIRWAFKNPDCDGVELSYPH